MTPEQVATAAPLIDKLEQLNEFQLLLAGSKSIHVTVRNQEDRREGYPVLRESAVMLFQQQIDETKEKLRTLGVVFPGDPEPECPVAEAIMPEIRDQVDVDAVRDIFTDDVDPAAREPYQCPPATQPDHLTIKITGPQGCGKTVMANWLRAALAYWNGETRPAAAAGNAAREAFAGKPVTIIDGSGLDAQRYVVGDA